MASPEMVADAREGKERLIVVVATASPSILTLRRTLFRDCVPIFLISSWGMMVPGQ